MRTFQSGAVSGSVRISPPAVGLAIGPALCTPTLGPPALGSPTLAGVLLHDSNAITTKMTTKFFMNYCLVKVTLTRFAPCLEDDGTTTLNVVRSLLKANATLHSIRVR